MNEVDPKDEQKVTLRLSEDAHAKLSEMQQSGMFAQMLDGYRLAIALALAEDLIDAEGHRRGKTYINAGSLDPDGIIRDAVLESFGDKAGSPYEIAERLGEAGIHALAERLHRLPEMSPLFKALVTDT